MKLSFFIVCIIVIVYGCRPTNKPDSKIYKELSIDLTNTSGISQEPALELVKFVKLETTNKSLFDNVGKVIHFDNKLFVRTSMERTVSVLVFKDSGEFLFKIEKGRGPDELIFPSDIAIDSKNKELLVLERYNVLKRFDFEGKYVGSTSLNDMQMYLETVGDHWVTFDADINKKSENYARILKEDALVKEFFPKIVSDIRKSPFIYPNPFFKLGADSVLVSCFFSDTIYCVRNNGTDVRPYYVLNYHGRSANQPDRIKSIADVFEYRERCNAQNYGSGVQNLAKLGDKLFFSIIGNPQNFIVYDLKENMSVAHTSLFEGLPNIYGLAGYNEDALIFSITSPRLTDYFLKNPATGNESETVTQLRGASIHEDDNPILLFCKFKS